MTTQWRALIASAITAVLGTAGILRAATSTPEHNTPPPAHRTTPMPGMHMHHGAAGGDSVGDQGLGPPRRWRVRL